MFDEATIREQIIAKWRGVPCRLNGRDTQGVDCIGLLYGIFEDFGIQLPGKHIGKIGQNWLNRHVGIIRNICKRVTTPELGDIVLFKFKHTADMIHCGLYLGENKFIHCFGHNGVTVDDFNRYKPQLDRIMRLKGQAICRQK